MSDENLVALSVDLDEKLHRLKETIAKRGSLLLSYSGGVDSGLLAVLAHEVLGDKLRCVILNSPVIPKRAIYEAQAIAQRYGFTCDVVLDPLMMHDTFRKNPPNRCYYCKKISAGVLKEHAHQHHLAFIADGVNLSDFAEHRPGIEATTEDGIIHPFVEAGITKADIRAIALKMGLDFWDKPSSACLSSRISYGEEISEEKLRIIEEAEEFLRAAGLTQVRVRLHSHIARIELYDAELPQVHAIKKDVVKKFKDLGCTYVTLDLEGYRSGSMDEVL